MLRHYFRKWLNTGLVLLGVLGLAIQAGAQVNTGGNATTANHQKQIVGYITNWDAWKSANHGVPGAGALTHMNIDYAKYTILNYSFFGVASDGSLHSGDYRNKQIYQSGQTQAPSPLLHGGVYDSWDMHLIFGELEYKWDFADAAVQAAGFVADGAGWKNTINGLTGPMPIPMHKAGGAKGLIDMAHERGVKVMASIGGWSMCKHFPEMAADPAKRAKFIADCNRLMILGFDGIDLDWEYPGPYAGMNFTGSQADFANFTALVQQIRTAIGPNKLITAAFSAAPAKIQGFNWTTLAGLMNYFNMMTYDFNGGWSGIAGHNAPLYDYPGAEASNWSWNATYNALVSMGVPANKINMGAPFYGRGVVTAGAAALNGATQKTQRTVDPDGPVSTAADYTNWAAFDGTPNYEYIRQTKASWTEHWDDNAKVPYLTKGNYFLSYDNEQSIGLKAQYVVDKGLAGTIVWTVFGDLEVSGAATAFGPKLVRYSSVKSPLVNKINEVFAQGNTGMPTVSITAPVNGTTVAPGASVTINAAASDANGSITKVEFLLDGTKVGEDTSSPYSYTIASLAAGAHSLVARATDNSGNTATTTVSITASTNSTPVVSITSPAAGASFTAGSAITITANATDNGSIAKTAFYHGTTLIGEDTSSPYSFTWSNVPAGPYVLTAVATDNEGATGTSAAVTITVTGGTDGCASVPAWDAAAVYTKDMEVKYNGVRYRAKWWTQNENPETHSGESGVWLNVAPCGTSNNGTPVATITAPASGSAFTAPASVGITATATDSDGTIAKVEFYNGGTKLGEDTSSPYSFTWSNVAAGTYAITAVATDNTGAAGTSAVVNVTVNNTGGTSNFKVVGYMPSWQGTADAIQYAKLTHIIYAFIRPTTTGGLTAVDNGAKLSDIVSRAHANNVKVSIAVGGWSDLNNADFQSMAANAGYRATFINNIVSLINTYQLDGVDIDWEYPIDGQDPANFATLMTELGNAMHSRGKLLTAAVSAQGYYANGVQSSVFNAVDFLNLMVYDGGSGADHSPYSYAVSSLDYWLGRGLPASKATLGVPFYARPSWKKFSELVAQGADPYADVYQGDHYNGITTIKNKTNLAFDRGIAGMMIWEISQDAPEPNSLLTAIKQVVDQRSGGGTNPAPTVSLTAPAAGSTYTAPATVSITANASDNGSVAKVEFYNGATKLGEDSTSPYAYTWSNVAAGTYSLTARAIDNEGATGTSTQVNITVNGNTGGCNAAQYVENGGYVAGSQVKNAGSIYQCREWPYSGWCNGAAWAYAPGAGTYWQDAWTLVGPCASAAAVIATEAMVVENAISYSPNPFTDKLGIDLTLDAETDVTLTLYDFTGQAGQKVFEGRKTAGTHHFEADASTLPKGLYILKVDKVKQGTRQPGHYIHLVKK